MAKEFKPMFSAREVDMMASGDDPHDQPTDRAGASIPPIHEVNEVPPQRELDVHFPLPRRVGVVFTATNSPIDSTI